MFKHWKTDLQSSFVVFLVALPLCLGIALASNAPLSAGLYAGIIGGIIIGFFSGSHVSVSGPAAGLTVIVAAAIGNLGSFEAFTMAVVLSGILQIIFSFLKGGALGDYFPNSVIKGMLAAIGIILILKQFPHAIGYDTDFMGDESFKLSSGENTFSQIFVSLKMLHPGAVIISAISIPLMLFWEKLGSKGMKIFQLIPGALVAVLLSIVLNAFFLSSFPNLAITGDHLVSLPFNGGFGEFFSGFKLPDFSALTTSGVYITAITIALVGSIESLLSIEASDKIDTQLRKTNKNRELFAQGIGNSVSGLIGGLPITAVIVRSSANVSAGAKTKLSGILHGFWLFLCVVFIPSLLNMIPLAVLACVLILVGYKLTKIDLIRSMFKKGWNQFLPFIITIIAILLTDLLMGIGIGMVFGFIFVIRSNMQKAVVVVKDDEHYLVKFHKDMSFLQKRVLLQELSSIPKGASVVIDGSGTVFIDDDIISVIEEYVKGCQSSGIVVELKKSSLALCKLFKE